MKKPNARPAEMGPACTIDSHPDAAKPRTVKIGIADVVTSLNGRDEGKSFLVIGTEDDYSLLADGKGRKFEKPKRKNNKHLKLEEKIDAHITDKLINGEKVTNNEIRRALAQYTADRGENSSEEVAGGM